MWPKLKRTWCSVAYKGIIHDSLVSSHQSAIHWFVFPPKHELSVLQSFHWYFWNSVSSDTALIPAIIQYRYGAPCNQHTAFLLCCCLLSKGFDSDWRCLENTCFSLFAAASFFSSTVPSRVCLILELSSCCAGICSLCSLMPSMLQHAINGGSAFCRCSFYSFVKYKAEGVKGLLQFLTVCKEEKSCLLHYIQIYFGVFWY